VVPVEGKKRVGLSSFFNTNLRNVPVVSPPSVIEKKRVIVGDDNTAASISALD
jgi:hypothetical protein